MLYNLPPTVAGIQDKVIVIIQNQAIGWCLVLISHPGSDIKDIYVVTKKE